MTDEQKKTQEDIKRLIARDSDNVVAAAAIVVDARRLGMTPSEIDKAWALGLGLWHGIKDHLDD
jgi:hypothetical protein